MTPAEFSAALARTRLKARAAGYARRVLVDGIGKTEAAHEAGLTPQAVDQAVRRVEHAHKNIIGCPRGWVCITVSVPEFGEAHFAIEELERAEWKKAGLLVS